MFKEALNLYKDALDICSALSREESDGIDDGLSITVALHITHKLGTLSCQVGDLDGAERYE